MDLRGIGIGQGLVVGQVLKMAGPRSAPLDIVPSGTVEAEIDRLKVAVATVATQFRSRASQVDGIAADVLEADALIVEDPMLAEDMSALVKAGKCAERAVYEGVGKFRDLLVGLGGYLAERASDLNDISQRIIAELMGEPAPGVPDPGFPFVLIAHDLAPADTALLDLSKVLALVTANGGPTSHTAILAREKAITAIVGAAGAMSVDDGQFVIVDAVAGTLQTDPSANEIDEARQESAVRLAAISGVKGPMGRADGIVVPLRANLGSPSDAAAAASKGADGVGLFRTEFLYLDAKTAPTIAEQQAEYEEVLAAFPDRKVVVRVLDAGADKPLSFLSIEDEENPALGMRGLRALRANGVILRDQLIALANARQRARGKLWVMAPMVSTVEEARYFATAVHAVGLPMAGVMIEVPSAALLADQILAEVDFVSIGTNDLTQYTMAADRMLGSLAGLQDPWHPAVLRLIAEVGRAGISHGKPVGVCGEAAADPWLAVVLVGLGATSLSMSPAAIPAVRAQLASVTIAEARELARVALASAGANESRTAVQEAHILWAQREI